MEHSLNFDPLRPDDDPAAERGHIGVTVRSAGVVVADTVIRGEDRAFPAGEALTPTLAIRPVDVANDLDLEVRLYSPAGDPVMVETSDTLGVTFAPATLEIEQATVRASSVAVGPTRTEMALGELDSDSTIVDRIERGAIRFRILNPFTVAGELDVAFEVPETTIERTVPIEPGVSSDRAQRRGAAPDPGLGDRYRGHGRQRLRHGRHRDRHPDPGAGPGERLRAGHPHR